MRSVELDGVEDQRIEGERLGLDRDPVVGQDERSFEAKIVRVRDEVPVVPKS